MGISKRHLITKERLYILFHQVTYLLTGLSSTLAIQWIFYHGAATGDSYLTQLAQFMSMILVGFLIPALKKKKERQYKMLPQQENESIPMSFVHEEPTGYVEGKINHGSVFKLALIDMLANSCVTLGFSIIGSGMYQVIYSSVVIWCAILTFFIMKRKLSLLQWTAIFGTSAGLAISSLDSMSGRDEGTEAKTALLLFGTLMTLGGTFFYACAYVYADSIMTQQDPAPLPARVCAYTGMYASMMSSLWIGIYTLPKFNQLIHIKPGTTQLQIAQMYGLLIGSNFLHAWNHYELIENTGSVATGILQGLRAVLIYILSNALYCKTDSAQCKTTAKKPIEES
ncbi:hypothetical protein BY458DRAFT_498768 [Sporodiniella umbellata]|nr:hypothetical protein BY458DRAFT_498768 [Sporodiniella umbellata]